MGQFEKHVPAAAKAAIEKQERCRSAEALRHPKPMTLSGFSANCEAAPFQSELKLTHHPSSCTKCSTCTIPRVSMARHQSCE
jgi:hypothetical protein